MAGSADARAAAASPACGAARGDWGASARRRRTPGQGVIGELHVRIAGPHRCGRGARGRGVPTASVARF